MTGKIKKMNNQDLGVIEKYQSENPWGMSTCVDLYNCNLAIMKDADKIKQFVKELVEVLKMKAFGETVVVDFGEDPRVSGFSMTQLIETSLISGHFANNSLGVYLDIFSCKAYGPYEAAEFCKKFFEASSMEVKVNFRR